MIGNSCRQKASTIGDSDERLVIQMKGWQTLSIGTLLVCLFVAGAGAVSISLDKTDLASNEEITATVTDMVDGVHYEQKITVVQHIKPGMPSAFGANNITWPFAHEDDKFVMTNENTLSNKVYIGHWWPADGKDPQSGYEDGLWQSNSVNGKWRDVFNYEFDQTGTYHTTWYSKPESGADTVTSTFTIYGTKLSGPEDFVEKTSFWSVNPADVTIEWFADDVLVSSETITLDDVGGAYFIAIPDVLKVGNKISFTLIPASGKKVAAGTGYFDQSVWWSFDADDHLKTWNSRLRNPNFYYPRWASGFQSPLVEIKYTDGSKETVERSDYVQIISDRVSRTRFFDYHANL